jgi:hypothetical protein
MVTLFIEGVREYGSRVGCIFWHSQTIGGGAA